jgi:hypothetical protein
MTFECTLCNRRRLCNFPFVSLHLNISDISYKCNYIFEYNLMKIVCRSDKGQRKENVTWETFNKAFYKFSGKHNVKITELITRRRRVVCTNTRKCGNNFDFDLQYYKCVIFTLQYEGYSAFYSLVLISYLITRVKSHDLNNYK